MINSVIFSQTDLNESNQFVYTHNLNTQVIAPSLIDDEGVNQTTVGVFAFGNENGNDPDNKVTISMNGTITGYWTLQLNYNGNLETLNGKRIFEQTVKELVNVSASDRFALGRVGVQAYNMTLGRLIEFMQSARGLGGYFFKTEDNLKYCNTALVRDHIGVYDTVAVDNKLSGKAGLWGGSASGAALGTGNTESYTPSTDYNPSTKKYVDDINTAQASSIANVIKYIGTVTYSVHNSGGTDVWSFGIVSYKNPLNINPTIAFNNETTPINIYHGIPNVACFIQANVVDELDYTYPHYQVYAFDSGVHIANNGFSPDYDKIYKFTLMLVSIV